MDRISSPLFSHRFLRGSNFRLMKVHFWSCLRIQIEKKNRCIAVKCKVELIFQASVSVYVNWLNSKKNIKIYSIEYVDV